MKSRPETATTERVLVCVVDDDESVRESLPDLLKELGFEARAFSSGQEFLASDCLNRTACLILDISMPGMTGFDLQRELRLRDQRIPIIFITAQMEGTLRANALGGGAVGFLLKPFSDTALLASVKAALRTT